MSILDKKGIGVTSGFKLVSGAPIDARFTAEDETDLQSLIDNGAVYEGLEVYVKSTKKKMQYNGTEFVEVSAGGGSGGGISKVFEDVSELPESLNSSLIYRIKATNKPVPSDGSTIGTVYFNTNLSISEVIGKINSYDIPWVDSSVFGWPSLELYPICMFDGSSFELFNNDPYVALIFSRTKADHSAVIITFACFATGKFVDIFLSTGSGWSGTGLVSNAMQQINIPVNGITEFQGLSIGTHNNLIKDIISSNGLFNSDTKYYNYDGENVNLLNKNSKEYTIELQHKYNMTSEEFKSSLEAYELPKEVINNFYEYNVKLLIKDTDVNGYTTDYYFDLVDSEYTQGENESLGVSGVELRFSRITRDKIQYIKISNAYVLAEGIHTLVKNNAYYDDIYIAGNVHTVDTKMSDSSINPVRNNVIKKYVDNAVANVNGGSNIDIHIEDDTLVINTDGTSSGSSGGGGELSIAAEIPVSSEKNEINISSVLQTLCDKLDKSKKYYLGFKFTTELNFGMTYSATTNNGVVITANPSASLGWEANIISANSSCLVSAPEGVVTPASFVVVNHIMTWGGTLGCTASVSIRKLDNTIAELTSRILRHSVVITAHEIEEA